jgi:sporulation protein YlmC with PRC-barrel domain
MRIDSLRHLVVIDPTTACLVGKVTDYWINPTASRVAALLLRPPDVDQPQRVSSSLVARVGRHAVMLAHTRGPSTALMEPTPSNWLDRSHLQRLVVYTDTGERLGKVSQADIDPVTLEVNNYELALPFWRRWLPGRRRVEGDHIAWCGRDVLVMRTDEPVKLQPVGRESGELTEVPAGPQSHSATTASRNGSSALKV